MPAFVLGLAMLYALSGAVGHSPAREQFIMRRPAPATATLWVDAATGSDSNTIAQVRAGNGAVKWASIGRAAWGSTNRSSPNTSEAAAAGDTVSIAAGTYTYSGSAVTNRFVPVYNPANEGTSGSPITFSASGTVTLVASSSDSPVIGCSARDYIAWTGAFSIDESNLAVVADTGPVTLHDGVGCQIIGTTIQGRAVTGWANDNHNGIRVEAMVDGVIRNNTIRDFENTDVTQNGTCITIYNSDGTLVEHNLLTGCTAGLAFKGNGAISIPVQQNNVIRLNRIDDVLLCTWSSMNALSPGEYDRNYIYQNLCTNASTGHRYYGLGLNDWIVNNTYVTLSTACFAQNSDAITSGVRFWNNVCASTTAGLSLQSGGGTWPADTETDVEHNDYYNYSTFYVGDAEGNLTFAAWTAAHADQDQASPVSITSDPIFANAAGSDYRLCTAAGVPDATCSGASPAIALGVDLLDLDGDSSTSDTIPAGAYVTGAETIGVES